MSSSKRTGPTYETAGAVIGAATGLAVGGVVPQFSSSYMEWGEGTPSPMVSMVTMGLFGLVGMLIGAGIGQRIPKRTRTA